MADLLSPAERQQIRDAFRDTMDTYSRTPVTLRRAGVAMSRFNEDRNVAYTDYTFNAICTYGKDGNAEDSNLSGKTERITVEVAVHIDVLAGLGLIIDGLPMINPTTDLLVIAGRIFEITTVSPQGQVDSTQTKANIKGRIQEKFYDGASL